MTVELMPLPYPYDALEPAMSRETLGYHHDKHHRGYVDKLNKLLERSSTRTDLEHLVRTSKDELFDNAAQVWNHNFLWKCLRPVGGKGPADTLVKALSQHWKTLDDFRQEFTESAIEHFGSGWTWLAMDGDRLQVISTSDADTPIRSGLIPLLTCDVWEHAYYIDYRNKRDEYVAAFWTVVNWDHVEAERQLAASASEEGRRARPRQAGNR